MADFSDVAAQLNTIQRNVTYAGPKVVGDMISFGKISESQPKLAAPKKTAYKEHVSMHSYDNAVGLSHSCSLAAGLERGKNQDPVFASQTIQRPQFGHDRLRSDPGFGRRGPGAYDLSNLSMSSPSNIVACPTRAVFQSKLSRVPSTKIDCPNDSLGNSAKYDNKSWRPACYTKFSQQPRFDEEDDRQESGNVTATPSTHDAGKFRKQRRNPGGSECAVDYYELEAHVGRRAVDKYIPMGGAAPSSYIGSSASGMTYSTPGTSTASSGPQVSGSRLFEKKYVFDRYRNLQMVRGVPEGAARSELLDLSGAEMLTCQEIPEVAMMCYQATVRAFERKQSQREQHEQATAANTRGLMKSKLKAKVTAKEKQQQQQQQQKMKMKMKQQEVDESEHPHRKAPVPFALLRTASVLRRQERQRQAEEREKKRLTEEREREEERRKAQGQQRMLGDDDLDMVPAGINLYSAGMGKGGPPGLSSQFGQGQKYSRSSSPTNMTKAASIHTNHTHGGRRGTFCMEAGNKPAEAARNSKSNQQMSSTTNSSIGLFQMGSSLVPKKRAGGAWGGDPHADTAAAAAAAALPGTIREGYRYRASYVEYDVPHKIGGLKLANNWLSSLSGLEANLKTLQLDLTHITYLDLSFNKLSSLEISVIVSNKSSNSNRRGQKPSEEETKPKQQCAILCFPNLRLLNLTGNELSSLRALQGLKALPGLRTLALLGNPVCTVKGYRKHLMKKLDSNAITSKERDDAAVWRRMAAGSREKRKKTD